MATAKQYEGYEMRTVGDLPPTPGVEDPEIGVGGDVGRDGLASGESDVNPAMVKDKPKTSIPLLGAMTLFGATFVALAVLLGLIISCRIGDLCNVEDIGGDRYTFRTVPSLVPFQYVWGSLTAGILGMAVLSYYAFSVLRQDVGTDRMVEIATYIREGSVAFLFTEYLYLSVLVVALFILIGFALNWPAAGCYAIGAVLSAATGYLGMSIATRGNVRTAAAAQRGLSEGLNVAFRAGAVMGLSVVAIGLSGLSFVFLLFRDVRALAGFSAGASTIALFARVGGGIYTKAADVGADLVGKVEANIPEDDPRNPATIADNVGDNVGDVAGMGADLFESYVGSLVATAILGASLPFFLNSPRAMCVYNHLALDNQCVYRDGFGNKQSLAIALCTQGGTLGSAYPSLSVWQSNSMFVALPFMLAAAGVIVGILGTLYVWVSPKLATETDKGKIMESLLTSLRINIYASSLLIIGLAAALCWCLFGGPSDFTEARGFGEANLPRYTRVPGASCPPINTPIATNEFLQLVNDHYKPFDSLFFQFPGANEVPWRLFLCIVLGLVLGILIGALTEYFTAGSYGPTIGIAGAGEYGAGAVVIQGLGVGMLSVVIPLMLVGAVILGTYELFGTYGIALSAVGMLSTLGVTMATDAYGPVADNAGGIAEMAEMPAAVRDNTDALDALGNTTAATGKGFSNGSAVLTAYALLTALVQDSGLAPDALSLIEGTAHVTDADVVSLVDIYVVVSVFIGIMLPYFFGALTMLAVSRAAQAMIVEVRRQFRDIPGLREGAPGVRPEHVRCVNISTRSAIIEMVIPGALAILTPLIVGFGFGQRALIGLLLAAIGSGYMLGIMMSNAGGAWDNAKKLTESGFFGKNHSKGSEWHKATVAGDTVGDPFKDTSGPSMNIRTLSPAVLGVSIRNAVAGVSVCSRVPILHALLMFGACSNHMLAPLPPRHACRLVLFCLFWFDFCSHTLACQPPQLSRSWSPCRSCRYRSWSLAVTHVAGLGASSWWPPSPSLSFLGGGTCGTRTEWPSSPAASLTTAAATTAAAATRMAPTTRRGRWRSRPSATRPTVGSLSWWRRWSARGRWVSGVRRRLFLSTAPGWQTARRRARRWTWRWARRAGQPPWTRSTTRCNCQAWIRTLPSSRLFEQRRPSDRRQLFAGACTCPQCRYSLSLGPDGAPFVLVFVLRCAFPDCSPLLR